MQASKLNNKSLVARRGLETYPDEIQFGTLREGITYMAQFELINVGLDLCNFRIKQLPADTGLKILFKPGPVSFELSCSFLFVHFAQFP